MLPRALEPEVMDTPAEALAYDQMDHSTVNQEFVAELLQFVRSRRPLLLNGPHHVLDLGCGTALIPIELAKQSLKASITAVDAAQSMLTLAQQHLERKALTDRITLLLADAKRPLALQQPVDILMSNSLVHHLPDPRVFFAQVRELMQPGSIVFVRDLFRPTHEDEVQQLGTLYTAAADTEGRRLFTESLRAALTVNEVRELVAQCGFDPNQVMASSDRHWTWTCEV